MRSLETAMSDPSELSKRERQIMDVVYAHGEATITQLLQELPNPPMRGALRTLLRILEKKGHLTRRRQRRSDRQVTKSGGETVFRPIQPRARAGRSAFGRVLEIFFDGSLEKALASHLSDPGRAAKPSREELERLTALIEQAKKKGA